MNTVLEMNELQLALTNNATIYRDKAATITASDIGTELFVEWDIALKVAHKKFYEYAYHKNHNGFSGEGVDTDATPYMEALQVILNVLGDVNGHKFRKSKDTLDALAQYAYRERTVRVGDAQLKAEELSSAKARFKAVANGMNQDYIDNLEKEILTLQTELDVLDTMPESCKVTIDKVSYNKFKVNVERAIYTYIIKQQYMKTWEELELEEKELKEARKARRAAKRQAIAQARIDAQVPVEPEEA